MRSAKAKEQAMAAPKVSPVMDAAERFLVGDVVHEDEAHGATVVGRRYSSVPLLSGSVLQKVLPD